MTARSSISDVQVRTRRYAIAYSVTLLVGGAGPATLIVLELRGHAWRAETEPFYSLVAQVIPVLLLAFAVEQNLLQRRGLHRPVNDVLGMLVFLAVVVAAAAAEVLSLTLLAFPCDANSSSCVSWPDGLTAAATLAAAVAIPASIALIVLHGAIASELPWNRHARSVIAVANVAVRAAVASTIFITSGGFLLAVGARASTVFVALLASAVSVLFTRLRDRDEGRTLEIEIFGQGLTLESTGPEATDEVAREDVAEDDGGHATTTDAD